MSIIYLKERRREREKYITISFRVAKVGKRDETAEIFILLSRIPSSRDFSYPYPRDDRFARSVRRIVNRFSYLRDHPLISSRIVRSNDSSTDRYRNSDRNAALSTARLGAASLNLAFANAQCTRSSYSPSAADRSSSTRSIGLARTGCRVRRSLNSRSSC